MTRLSFVLRALRARSSALDQLCDSSNQAKKRKMRPDPSVREHANQRINLGSSIATVLVGEDGEHFAVHRALLTRSSDFFKKALNGNFKESAGTVELRAVEAGIFKLYEQWLYSGKFFTKQSSGDQVACEGPLSELEELMSCCLLADMIQDFGFHNAAIDAISEIVRKSPIVLYMKKEDWERLPPHSAVRKIVVDLWVYAADEENYKEFCEGLVDMPADFWMAVAEESRAKFNKATNKNIVGLYPWHINGHKYHIKRGGDQKDN